MDSSDTNCGDLRTPRSRQLLLAAFCVACTAFVLANSSSRGGHPSNETANEPGFTVRLLEDQAGIVLWVTSSSAQVQALYPEIDQAAVAIAEGHFRRVHQRATVQVWIPTRHDGRDGLGLARYYVYKIESGLNPDVRVLGRSMEFVLPGTDVLVPRAPVEHRLVPRGQAADVYVEFQSPEKVAKNYGARYLQRHPDISYVTVDAIRQPSEYDRFKVSRSSDGHVDVSAPERVRDPFETHHQEYMPSTGADE